MFKILKTKAEQAFQLIVAKQTNKQKPKKGEGGDIGNLIHC